jgi:hypothetical protein
MLKRLRRYAAMLSRGIAGRDRGDHLVYAEDVVQATVTDVISGVLAWDPAARPLEQYLIDTIRLRARRDGRRAARYKQVSIDAVRAGHRALPIDELEMQLATSASTTSGRGGEAVDLMSRSMQQLRDLVADDALAHRFLDAVADDATTRTEIMKAARLTRAEYHNTRRRLARLLGGLTREGDLLEKDN